PSIREIVLEVVYRNARIGAFFWFSGFLRMSVHRLLPRAFGGVAKRLRKACQTRAATTAAKMYCGEVTTRVSVLFCTPAATCQCPREIDAWFAAHESRAAAD